jgi:thiamine biosynthesis lipoprotein
VSPVQLGSPPSLAASLATARWDALGTTAVLRVTRPGALVYARELVQAELDRIDLACSRFRADSELERVNASAGRWSSVGPVLMEAIETAVRAARLTVGAVDPTLGEALIHAGYDRDFSSLDAEGAAVREGRPGARRAKTRRSSAWRLIELRYDPAEVRFPAGVRLDLGATAKALAADRAAAAVHEAIGAGVLVSLGGDISTAGPPSPGGWAIHVTDDHRAGPEAPGQTITIAGGGLATSSVTVRRWRKHGRAMHHILDPATGAPVRPVWRTASVVAATCVDANIASTAALVQGPSAPAWLDELKLPARLVGVAGEVRLVSGWPEDR